MNIASRQNRCWSKGTYIVSAFSMPVLGMLRNTAIDLSISKLPPTIIMQN
ncbi:MAG: hypothetical protein ABIF17_03640 [Patescibacteria group bacterium]